MTSWVPLYRLLQLKKLTWIFFKQNIFLKFPWTVNFQKKKKNWFEFFFNETNSIFSMDSNCLMLSKQSVHISNFWYQSIGGENWPLLLSCKLFNKILIFWNYLGKCSCFENRVIWKNLHKTQVPCKFFQVFAYNSILG